MDEVTKTQENDEICRKRTYSTMTDGDESLTKGGLPGGDHTMAKACAPSTSGAPTADPPPYQETEMSNAPVQHSTELLPSYSDATRKTAAAENCDTDTQPLPAFPEPSSAASAPTLPQIVQSGPPMDENQHRYVGLVNQAMTCYLNSLIQTLYMTPEFRNAMYRWEYNGKDEDRSIPYQIQKLFLLLQTTDKDSLETKDLTNSFGWSSSEAYDQHDVQELCRLMFDALEHRWKATDHEKLIQELYRGSMEDFVKCLACKKENSRKDYFLDLPLAVREFGATRAFHSVEEALNAFVKTEVLDGNNQYFCENCNAKQDAHKGLRITQFPKLLTIQLKRFDFDYNTMHRIKLNDRMTFPDVLNLNPFVGDNKPNFDDEKDQTVRAGESLDQKAVEALIKEEGEYVYELFSVMVHAGSAAGGHYFAYIKNMDQQSWYCFNDSRVDFCSPEDIMRSFGTSTITWSSSNANAYMLMYRKISQKNEAFLTTENLPRHINDSTAKWKRQEDEREEMLRYQASLVKVTVRLNLPGLSDALDFNRVFQKEIPKVRTLGSLLDEAIEFFDTEAPKDTLSSHKKNLRLLKCTPMWNIQAEFIARNHLTQTLEPHIPIGGYNPQLRTELYFLLDIKRPTGSFYPLEFTQTSNFSQSPKTYQIVCVDVVKEQIFSTFLAGIDYKETTLQVKKKLGGIFGVKEHEFLHFRLWTEKRGYNSDMSFAAPQIGDTVSQHAISYLSDPAYLFIDGGIPGCDSNTPEVVEDRKKPMMESKMYAVLERKKHETRLFIELPTIDEIQKVQSLPMGSTSSGPSLETTQTIEMPLSVGTAATDDPMSAVPSGRASSTSSLDGDDAMAIDSLCNNTPQMSPNVSENGDGYHSGEEDVGHGGLNSLLMKSWTANPPTMHPDPYLTPPATETDTLAATVDESDSSSGTLVPWQLHRDQIIVENEGSKLRINVDKRITVAKLKAWIGEKIKMEPTQFVLLKHHEENDNGYECGASSEMSDSVEQAFKSVNKISILLRPPLKDNEKLIHVSLFSIEEVDREKWKPLFEIPASKETLVSTFIGDCRRYYQAQYGENLPSERLRIRCLDNSFRAIVCLLNDSTLEKRGQQWLSKVFLQLIPEDLVDAEGDSIFIRRFKPSSMELGPMEEIFVNPTAWPDPVHATKETIAKRSGIPTDQIELVEPGGWDKWPFVKSRLDLLEKSDWRPTLISGDNCVTSNHGKVLYYRDSKEEPKKLTPDERKQISIKDRTVSSTTPRRHERPLRINMNSVSEQ
ncbi:unnamed protein product, partial [Mesorhabditis belari]|uniref:Ubiquitin carboxyl-terminal hydrolase 47 n=1 Tax=Mesorhabditis belari TaxID=2138241 RepID=A0AAF3ETX1_9BILA